MLPFEGFTPAGGMKFDKKSVGNNVRVSPHFRAHEFACSDGDYWLTHPALIVLLENIRAHFGAPIRVNSGFRTPAHNAKVGGSPHSRHLLGLAADIVVAGVDPQEVADYAETLGAGGVGRYNTFTHVDVGVKKRRWDFRGRK